MKRRPIEHEFVEFIPDVLADGILYVSIEYATAVHKCMSGCGLEVVTPLSPTDWELIFDGETVSLYPSVGNWGLPCGSHYWIKRDRVVWAPRWARDQIDRGRARDRLAKKTYLEERLGSRDDSEVGKPTPPRHNGWRRLRDWISGAKR